MSPQVSFKAVFLAWGGRVIVWAGGVNMRARLFIDFWNFQLDWNNFAGKNPASKHTEQWLETPL